MDELRYGAISPCEKRIATATHRPGIGRISSALPGSAL
jgi:hypothetical protein